MDERKKLAREIVTEARVPEGELFNICVEDLLEKHDTMELKLQRDFMRLVYNADKEPERWNKVRELLEGI